MFAEHIEYFTTAEDGGIPPGTLLKNRNQYVIYPVEVYSGNTFRIEYNRYLFRDFYLGEIFPTLVCWVQPEEIKMISLYRVMDVVVLWQNEYFGALISDFEPIQ